MQSYAQQVSEGVTKHILKPGIGSPVRRGDSITVHCMGTVVSPHAPPRKFWSTQDPGQNPFTFNVGMGQVIAGWDEGCMSMSNREAAVLTIPGHKGYGPQGFPAWGIPPNATLQFQIEILAVNGS